MLFSTGSLDHRRVLKIVDCTDILNCFLERFPDVSFEELPLGTRVVQMPVVLRNDLLSGMVLDVCNEDMPPCQRYSYGDIMSHIRAEALGGLEGEDRSLIRDSILNDEVVSHLQSLFLPEFSVFVESAWIQNDLLAILWTRKLKGRNNSTIEKIVKIYSSGCIPVGWYGCYPEEIHFLVVPHEVE
jgi:hypothetical protein